MKKIIFTLLALAFLSIGLSAQCCSKPNRVFKKGQTDVQFGIGILPSEVVMDKAIAKVLPLNIEVKRMLGQNFSLGVFYGFSIMEAQPKILKDKQELQLKKEFHQMGIRPTFHLTRFKNADYYGGFSISVNHHRMTALKGEMNYMKHHLGIQPKATRMAYNGIIGGRYAIKNRLSVFAEFNFGSASLLNAGIGYKL